LDKVKSFIKRRIAIAKIYDKAFSRNKEIETIKPDQDRKNAYHLYIIKTKNSESRLKLFNYLKENDIFCQVHYIPVYWHPYYRSLGYKKGTCSMAEKFYERIISIPMYFSLKDNEQKKVIKLINDFYA
jgi:dTDP-4-amino-4,6-dideoxygalactose transaminase